MPTAPMKPDTLITLIRDALIAGGFSPENARIVSDHLVDAEMKGVTSHGVNRLALYLDEAARNVIDPAAEPIITESRPGMLHVDGGKGIGIVAMKKATDAAILVARDIPADDVLLCIRGAAGENLTDLKLFDVYHGKGIDPLRKSLAVGLTWQHPSRTLNDDEVSTTTQNILTCLEQRFNATLRK